VGPTAASFLCTSKSQNLPAARAQVDAEKRTLLKALPHTLALHLKRFEWDYETYQRWKAGVCCGCAQPFV
jgi:hypothetical protein